MNTERLRTIRTHIAHHWPALVVALLACAHVMLPPLIGRIASGSAYQGVWVSNNGDWNYYVARIRDLSVGHSGGNPYIAEHAKAAYPNIPAAETVFAFIVRATHIDPVHLQIAMDVVVPILCTLLFYALLYRLSRSRLIASAIPLFLTALHIWNLDKPIHPGINLAMLFGFLLCWFSLLDTLDRRGAQATLAATLKSSWGRIVACGVSLGLLYLVYFYDWSFLYVVLGCAALTVIATRRWDVAMLNTLILAVSAPFTIVYFMLVRDAFNAPFYAELSVRIGVIASHLPETIPRTFMAIAACVLFFICIRAAGIVRTRMAHGVFALLLANVIYPNHQIITGVIFQTAAHWPLMPILVFALAAAFLYPHIVAHPPSLRRNATIVRVSGFLFFALFLVSTFRLAVYMVPPVTQGSVNAFVSAQRYGPALSYLRTVPEGSVVFANRELSSFIPTFTNNHIYYLWYIFSLPGGDREIMERYLLSHVFEPSFFQDKHLGITEQRRPLWGSPSGIEETTHAVHRMLGIPFTNQYALEREQAYALNVFGDLQVEDGIGFADVKKYRIDYVAWDKHAEPEWNLDRVAGLQKVFEAEQIAIYLVQ